MKTETHDDDTDTTKGLENTVEEFSSLLSEHRPSNNYLAKVSMALTKHNSLVKQIEQKEQKEKEARIKAKASAKELRRCLELASKSPKELEKFQQVSNNYLQLQEHKANNKSLKGSLERLSASLRDLKQDIVSELNITTKKAYNGLQTVLRSDAFLLTWIMSLGIGTTLLLKAYFGL